MKAVFYIAMKEREHAIAEAFRLGGRLYGIDVVTVHRKQYDGPLSDAHIAVVVGVKPPARRVLDEYRALSRRVIYVDKGYMSRVGTFEPMYKVSVNDFQPLEYLMQEDRPGDRFGALGYVIPEPRAHQPCPRGGTCLTSSVCAKLGRCSPTVLLLGPSQKYANFHGLGDATEWSKRVIQMLKQRAGVKVIYKPKHSWDGAVPIPGSRFSPPHERISELLVGVNAVVTHGSNGSVKAALSRVPVVTLGPAITVPIASSSLETAFIPDTARLRQWCNQVAYCQWSLREIALGLMWKDLLNRANLIS